MLFTDADQVTTGDLVALDPELPDVAGAERLVLEGERSVIRTAWGECASTLIERTEPYGGASNQFGWGTTGSSWITRQRLFLTQIVATDRYAATQSPVQRWLTYWALVVAYRSALSAVSNERYTIKLDAFTAEADKAWRAMQRRGIPTIREPLPAPGALHEALSGVWGESNLGLVAAESSGGATVPSGAAPASPGPAVWQIAITWVDGSRYRSGADRGNAESAPSQTLAMPVAADQQLRISIASLIPPTTGRPAGVLPGAESFSLLKATGWNVYAGPSGGPMILQNSSPIALDSDYTLPLTPATTGFPMETGQLPDSTYAFVNVVQRV